MDDFVTGSIIGGVLVGFIMFFLGGALGEDQGYKKSEAEWQTRIEDCSKMNGFVYNHQVFQCAATKKWAPNDFKGFM